jgi:hypothetical protein
MNYRQIYEGGNTKFLIDDKNENDISIIPKIVCLMDKNRVDV